MTEIISVRFRPGGKQYYFDPLGLTVETGQNVIVETGKGLEYGTCTRCNTMVDDQSVVQPLRPLVRLATQTDELQVQENRRREKEALHICQQLIERHKLDMKLVQVEYSFDGSKIIFFFTSDGRVDFRALVKDLAGIFRARIELRQIGVRDEARMLGGFGICGKPFCCSQFLNEFQPVSIKMAKIQNLSLNPTKISGTCGRLMCCLKYEQEAYEDAVQRCPKQDSFVECPDGVGTVSSVNLLKEQVKVRIEDSNEQPKSYLPSEIRVVRSGKGRRPDGYVSPDKAELEKLRDPQGEALRSGSDKPEGPRDLSSMLEHYLSNEKNIRQEEQPRSSNRSRRRRGNKDGKVSQSAAPTQERPRQDRTSSKGDRSRQEHPIQDNGGGARRRHRPNYRRGKPNGNQSQS